MEDQGEKIIFLARELLKADAPASPIRKKTINVTMTIKTLCFTTLLAAASGALISTIVYEQDRPLSRYEKVELQALVFYTARIKEIHEGLLRQEVEKQVGVSSFDDLTAREFSAARRFLQQKAQQ